MSRAERLLKLIEILRRHRFPVRGEDLASELKVSLRTLYRDIASLQAQGARIAGEAGVGYVLRPGFVLPPLMFEVEEVEALVLGSRWVAERGDAPLAAAAKNVIAKVSAVLPEHLRHQLETSGLMIGPPETMASAGAWLTALRSAIRKEHKIEIHYRDLSGRETRRVIWPFAIGFMDRAEVLIAWCELRQAIRHFRSDRIGELRALGERYPRSRAALLAQWREQEGVPAD